MAEVFKKLQDKLNNDEGLEGILDIIRVIYRVGTISVKNISRKTKLPVPLVAKVVNNLIEADMLYRNEDGVQLWEHAMKFCEKELGFYGFGIPECPKCKGRPFFLTPRFDKLFDVLNPIFERRPSVDTKLDQSKNTVETAIQRLLYIYNNGSLEGKNICLLGDDDFTSVAISKLYLSFFPEEPKIIPKNITVIDIDERILNSIKNEVEKDNLTINTIKYDLREPVPKNLRNKFDTIIMDPPYSTNGLKLFLSRAISLLRKPSKYDVKKDIFLSFAHKSQEKTLEFQKVIIESGLAIIEIIPAFNKYEGSEVLGNITQMIRLNTTLKSHPLIDPNSKFVMPIYTGETHPYIKKYKCVKCGEIIEVGPDKQFETIELLKGEKCPKCKNSKKFELIERNLKLDY
ncbi:MAG: bis-aminopropyl spermidine synthase family protein [Promethearchaeota archaeon]